MARKKREEKPRELTRRQLSHWQQQNRRQRIIFIAGITLIAAVFLLILSGWVVTQYLPLQQTAIKVNQTEFNMGYFIDRLRLAAAGQSPDQLSSIVDSTIQEIEQEELVKQGAAKLDITASENEIRDKLKELGVPVSKSSKDLARVQVLTQKLRDEYFEAQVPKSADQVHILAMLLEDEAQSIEVRDRLEKGESFAALAGERSLNPLTKKQKGDLEWHPKDILNWTLGSSLVGDYAFGVEVGSISQPIYDAETSKTVGYWLVKLIDRNEQLNEASIYVMLLGSEKEAEETRVRLVAGEDFATLAKELSQLSGAKDNGGNLEAVTPGVMTPALRDFIFNSNTKLDTLSQPIKDTDFPTRGGYWLVKVIEKNANRDLAESDRDTLKEKALTEWISAQVYDPENEVDDSFLTDEKKNWALTMATS